MKVVYNHTCVGYANAMMDIDIAKKTGYDGIEISALKLYRYIEAGLSLTDYIKELEGIEPVGISYIQDIERSEEEEVPLFAEAEKLFSLASQIGCKNVQVLTGPLAMGVLGNPNYPGVVLSGYYKRLLSREWKDVRAVTANNLKRLCRMASDYGIALYIELLGYTISGSLSRGIELIDECGCENIGIVMDFWHMYVADTAPEEIAKIDKSYINGIHICDSQDKEGKRISEDLRDIYLGLGKIPIKEYLDAIKATGYDGWISGESFAKKQLEMNSYDAAKTMCQYIRSVIV
jgi:sugar phosphate isomerase/epimerase